MSAACPVERYNRLFIVANHSEVIYPTQQRDIPSNMTVATLTQLNQSIHLRDDQIPTDQFRHLFSKYGKQRDSRGFAPRVLPTDSDVMGLLSRLSAMGIVYATHNGKRQPCDFRQRKHQAEMTVQMCFLPGALVHSAIYEFSPTHETGMDVSDVILGQKVNPGMQLYRDTSPKDSLIIEAEKAIMAPHVPPGGFTKCPPDHLIMSHSHGNIVQADIDSLRENRTKYRSAIQFEPPMDIFCSYDIADVEQLRQQILDLVIKHDNKAQSRWVESYRDVAGPDATLREIRLSLKPKKVVLSPLVNFLIHNVIMSIHRSKSLSDYKSVTTGHTPIRSDELFGKIREYSRDEKVYVVFIGCRHVPSSDPAVLAVMHSPRSSRGSRGSIVDFRGGRKLRRRSMNKPKTRKTSKRIHKKIIINRSQHRSHRR